MQSRYKLRNPSIELIIQEQINRWFKQGIIVESTSPYSSRLVAVKKHGSNKMRICLDLRLINEKLLAQSYPFPDIKKSLQNMKNAQVFSRFDQQNAYHQLEIDEKDQHKTAFMTRDNLFHFKLVLLVFDS